MMTTSQIDHTHVGFSNVSVQLTTNPTRNHTQYLPKKSLVFYEFLNDGSFSN